MLILFKSIVLSRLDYGSQLWSSYLIKHIPQLENIQRSGLRILDNEKENCMNISKLPDKLVYRWTRGVSDHIHKFGERENDISCDPVLSMQTVASVRKHYVSNKSSDESFVHDIRAAQVKHL